MKLTTTQLRRIIREEAEAMMPTGGKDPQRFLHGFESGRPMDDEGYMIKSRMADVKEMAETICGLLDGGDQLPAWVQDLVASAHTDLEHVKDYLVGDEKLRSYDNSPAGNFAEAYISGATKKMSGGRPSAEMAAGAKKTPDDVKKENLRKEITFMKSQIKKAKSGKLKGQDVSTMQSHLEDLEAQMKTESRTSHGGMLLEGHNRITPEEMSAWMGGDFGFVSEAPRKRGVPMPSDEEILEKYGHMTGYLDAKSGSHDPLWDELSRTYGSDFKTQDYIYDRLRALQGSTSVAESRRRGVKKLSEGHARITQSEFAAWKRGDWGFVSEGLDGVKDMTRSEAEAFIASKDPNETVEQDIIDSETGEIYAEVGQTYGSSYLHPKRPVKRSPMHIDADLDDESDTDDDAYAEYEAALKDFAAGWGENPVPDVDPEDVASDAALSFFHMYPQWKTWAVKLGLTKADIQSAAAEAAYESMI